MTTAIRPKRLALLGSTGSIGTQVLDLVRLFPDRFQVCGLAAGRNTDLLQTQVEEFRPPWVSLATREDATAFKAGKRQATAPQVFWGPEGLERIAGLPEADLVVSALVGAVGLRPTLTAIRSGKTIALANKEPLVMAGELLLEEARRRNVAILPVDSEHSAVFQALQGQQKKDLKRIILTASGGPFRTWSADQIAAITGPEALNHPNWKMGPKITIDSATLMNKGLEVIEARWLFGVSLEQITVVVHPQSIVHSLVEFQDGSLLAQLGPPDMRLPIAYALAYPDRLPLPHSALDLTGLSGLTFFEPDLEKFPCLALAWQAARAGGSLPIVLNAANEVAVAAFLRGELPFGGIPRIIRRIMEKHAIIHPRGLEEILAVDEKIRSLTETLIRAEGR
ncbi:MAG: 1-deoxy-D-xylulose-5-phosphate reductoisomerase [Deltaproteobacteria bacterium]|nr:1-deoxy-D-xylulose-5-phosphate reductoisomerase [Deltaproteobacteria bacterium]